MWVGKTKIVFFVSDILCQTALDAINHFFSAAFDLAILLLSSAGLSADVILSGASFSLC